jgi:succinate-acetate transporter protein
LSATHLNTIDMSEKSNNNNNTYEQDGAEAKEIAKYLRKWLIHHVMMLLITCRHPVKSNSQNHSLQHTFHSRASPASMI